MVFLSVLIAFLLEQARPLAQGNLVHAGLRAWVRAMVKHLDAGGVRQAWLAWGAAVLFPAVVAGSVHVLLLASTGFIGAACWSVAVLYATLGFRQFSHHFTAIRDALEDGDDVAARRLLQAWQAQGVPAGDQAPGSQADTLRRFIEHSVLAGHRHVFGVLAWFSVFAFLGFGPFGAVLYRLAEFVPRYWGHQSSRLVQPISPALLGFARRAWHGVDWLPARLSGLAFAVVGSFEDALHAWRRVAERMGETLTNDQVVLAGAGGAMGIELDSPIPSLEDPDQGAHAARLASPTLGHLQSVVGLVWRGVVLWMVVLALVSLGR